MYLRYVVQRDFNLNVILFTPSRKPVKQKKSFIWQSAVLNID